MLSKIMSVTQKYDGRWAVIQYIDGKQQWKYFGRGIEAEKAARDYDASIKDAGQVRAYKKRPRSFGPTITELVEAYLRAKAAILSAVSIRNTTYKFTSVILPEIGHLKAMNLTAEKLDKYVLKRAGVVKMTTIHRDLSDLQAALNWAVKRRLIPSNPVYGYEKPKRDDAIIRPPSSAEIKAILAKAPDHLKRALTISYYTGLRPGNAELFRLQWADVDLDAEILYVLSAQKGGIRQRTIPIHPAFKKMLEQWQKADSGKGFLIRYNGKPVKSIKTTWRTTKAKAGITRRLRPYDLRHAFASEMLAHGGDLKTTSELLGHTRTETTTRIYQHTNHSMHRANISQLPDID
jgi:integrase